MAFRLPNNIIDLQPFEELLESDPKTIVITLAKACIDMKVIACVVCFFIGIFFIAVDTVYTPMMKAVQIREDYINAEKKNIVEKEQQKRQFEQWDRDVATVATKMVRLKPEQSAKVISLKESEKVISVARGSGPLPEPHHKRESILLTALDNQSLNILNGQVSAAGGRCASATSGRRTEQSFGCGAGNAQRYH